MSSREIVWQTIRFQNPQRLARDLPLPWLSDLILLSMNPNPDGRPHGHLVQDEWGTVWDNIGVCQLGEVVKPSLLEWSDFDRLPKPDVTDQSRWASLNDARKRAGERLLIGHGISLYERVHFLRGLQNAWMDIHLAPEELGRLIDLLVEMNLAAIDRYAALGFDGYIWPDDWGLQNRLMIDPASWRAIWKPRYARVFEAAHKAGMATFLHSCGHIVDILDDLIEAGLDVIQMDQQANMGLELLGQRFGGRITFWCPVDIQTVMPRANANEICSYVQQMMRCLGRREGGFIAKHYSDPKGAGHTDDALRVMCQEFTRLGERMDWLSSCKKS